MIEDGDMLLAEIKILVTYHRLTRDLSKATREDLAQDVAFKYLRTFQDEGPDNRAAWLETAMRNAAIDRARKEGREPRFEQPPRGEDDEGENPVDRLRDRAAASLPALRNDVLTRLLRALPTASAEIIRWRVIDDLDGAVVAARLGISRAAVDQRMSRARRELKALLEQRPDLLADLREAHPRLYATSRL